MTESHAIKKGDAKRISMDSIMSLYGALYVVLFAGNFRLPFDCLLTPSFMFVLIFIQLLEL
ncbi:hypothetical protein JCM12294_14140 [Desulfocicer niacini]